MAYHDELSDAPVPRMLDLTRQQWSLILSAHQNGHLFEHETERADVAKLVRDGLLEWINPAKIPLWGVRVTEKMDRLLNTAQEDWLASERRLDGVPQTENPHSYGPYPAKWLEGWLAADALI
jgi:hypothetical protein